MVSPTGCTRVSVIAWLSVTTGLHDICWTTVHTFSCEQQNDVNLAKKSNLFPPSSLPEEVFASNGAIWWSTTGKYFAYAEFNDTEVQKVEFPWYGSGQYPETMAIPYPKVRQEYSACVVNILIQHKWCFLFIFLPVGYTLIMKVTACRVGTGRICPH